MIERVPEREAMDSAQDANDYDMMDHSSVNAAFADDLIQAASRRGCSPFRECVVIDVGTGTARIPIALCRRARPWKVLGVDLAHEMLMVGKKNVEAAGLRMGVTLQRGSATALPFADGRCELLTSNSLIHHLPAPAEALRDLCRVASPGGLIFVRDLLRPESESAIEDLVLTYADSAPAGQRNLFAASLKAAFTMGEMRDMIEALPFAEASLEASSDRHWTLAAVRAR